MSGVTRFIAAKGSEEPIETSQSRAGSSISTRSLRGPRHSIAMHQAPHGTHAACSRCSPPSTRRASAERQLDGVLPWPGKFIVIVVEVIRWRRTDSIVVKPEQGERLVEMTLRYSHLSSEVGRSAVQLLNRHGNSVAASTTRFKEGQLISELRM